MQGVQVTAAEAVMVGDSLAQDIEGARQLGMRGVLVARSGRQAAAPDDVPVIQSLRELPALLWMLIRRLTHARGLPQALRRSSGSSGATPTPRTSFRRQSSSCRSGAAESFSVRSTIPGSCRASCSRCPGLKDGRLIQWSHMLGVVPDARHAGIGLALKLAQREEALRAGVELIEWTFDPLQTLNAHLNFARLGVIVEEYEENIYGESSSPLHRGRRRTGSSRSGG